MLCHIYRWKLVDHGLTFTNGYIGIESHFVYPLGIYFAWQVAYLLMTGKFYLFERSGAQNWM